MQKWRWKINLYFVCFQKQRSLSGQIDIGETVKIAYVEQSRVGSPTMIGLFGKQYLMDKDSFRLVTMKFHQEFMSVGSTLKALISKS